MSWWSILVYGVAALWGIRILLALMVQHRQRHLDQLIDSERARLEPETSPEPDQQDVVIRKAA